MRARFLAISLKSSVLSSLVRSSIADWLAGRDPVLEAAIRHR